MAKFLTAYRRSVFHPLSTLLAHQATCALRTAQVEDCGWLMPDQQTDALRAQRRTNATNL